MEKSNLDDVKRPSHYAIRVKGIDIEVKDIIEEVLNTDSSITSNFEAYCKGNILKYVLRSGKKGAPKKDLLKAAEYIGYITFDRSVDSQKDTKECKGYKEYRNAEGHLQRQYKNENGETHRTDGPAFESSDGTKEWWVNGKRHRTDGPAFESSDGTKEWWVNGKHHRTDGPAVERSDGHKIWFLNGRFHRTDGPALEYVDGRKEWRIQDCPVGIIKNQDDIRIGWDSKSTIAEWDDWFIKSDEPINYCFHRYERDSKEFKALLQLWEQFKSQVCTKGYRNAEGRPHRTDGPAIESKNGDKYWYLNGQLHREDGPAIEHPEGYKEWHINGELHREDGPAIEHPAKGLAV